MHSSIPLSYHCQNNLSTNNQSNNSHAYNILLDFQHTNIKSVPQDPSLSFDLRWHLFPRIIMCYVSATFLRLVDFFYKSHMMCTHQDYRAYPFHTLLLGKLLLKAQFVLYLSNEVFPDTAGRNFITLYVYL